MQEKEPRLPGLLKMLVWAQDHLAEKLIYPVRPPAACPQAHRAPDVTATCKLFYRVMALLSGSFSCQGYKIASQCHATAVVSTQSKKGSAQIVHQLDQRLYHGSCQIRCLP